MNRIIVFTVLLFCIVMQLKAQVLSEEEVSGKMFQAFKLNKAGKKAEALELFLCVGENTKLQRNEGERQVYVYAVRPWLASVMNCLAGIKKGIS